MKPEDLEQVKMNFRWIVNELEHCIQAPRPLVVIIMGSPTDEQHCQKIATHLSSLGLSSELRVCSAHKSTEEMLQMVAAYESTGENVR